MKKKNIFPAIFFVIGLLLYLVGIVLLFSSTLRKIPLFNDLFLKFISSDVILSKFKIIGGILFIIGFIIFMVSVVLLYKNNNVYDNSVNLIIEGKADVITLVVMTYIMIFMIVVCLLYNEIVGALLFGVAIVIESVLNNILISYYSKMYKKK